MIASYTAVLIQITCAINFEEKLQELNKENYEPDVIVSHSGWGCGLFAKTIFPKSKLICYCEWWFKHDADEFKLKKNEFINYSKKVRRNMYLRNLALAAELAEADELVTPTKWQKNQFPERLSRSMHVIHEGVDTNYFVQNDSWKKKDRCVITYATRGMEPIRGFPEMINAMDKILSEYNNVDLIIAGEDKVFYGANLGKLDSFGSWGKTVLSKHIRNHRVKFVGRLQKQKYARLLKMSDIHLYFTRPFIASWSLLEAMSSGCFLVTTMKNQLKKL